MSPVRARPALPPATRPERPSARCATCGAPVDVLLSVPWAIVHYDPRAATPVLCTDAHLYPEVVSLWLAPPKAAAAPEGGARETGRAAPGPIAARIPRDCGSGA